MKIKTSNRGGYRPNAGRKPTGRNNSLQIMISDEAKELLAGRKNKSEYIDYLIRKDAN